MKLGMKKMNLIEKIQKLAYDDQDEADIDQQSKILEDIYKQASPEIKKKLDEMTICVCGFSIESILKNIDEIKERLEE